jgi:hypothetical protein
VNNWHVSGNLPGPLNRFLFSDLQPYPILW